MSGRYRLNLEAPFLQSANPAHNLTSTNSFRRATANDVSSWQETDTHLRRPSPRNRAKGVDYTGETMARYLSGLETRLARHIQKHSTRWHEAETRKILRRWSVPQAKPPAPRWAPPPNREKDARDYAAALLRERLRTRMQRLADIRIARTLGDEAQVRPRRTLRMKA